MCDILMFYQGSGEVWMRVAGRETAHFVSGFCMGYAKVEQRVSHKVPQRVSAFKVSRFCQGSAGFQG